jgi:hypothetical protein
VAKAFTLCAESQGRKAPKFGQDEQLVVGKSRRFYVTIDPKSTDMINRELGTGSLNELA